MTARDVVSLSLNSGAQTTRMKKAAWRGAMACACIKKQKTLA